MRGIVASIFGIPAIISLVICIMSFMEKGFLFNNAYIWASKQEREKMDKKPHYRQSAIVFAMLTGIFTCMTVDFILQTEWIGIITCLLTMALLIYAIASSVKELKK